MRILICLVILSFNLQKAAGQFFTNVSSAVSPFGYGYLSNGITITNLGVLDGINLGVVSIDITLTSQGSPELYLVGPEGHSVYILSGSTAFNVTNGNYTFTNDLSAPSIKYLPYTSSIPGTYTPYGNLNAFNAGQLAGGQQPANGLWRLYGKTGGTATVTRWQINFGNTNLLPAPTNQSFAKALPLINTTATGNFVSGSNQYHGVVLTADSKGTEVGNSGYTETSIWYSFIPKCKNDRIEVTSANSYIQSGILTSTRNIVSTNSNIINSTYTFPITTFTPGNTYYLVMDGNEADIFQYQVKWYEGTQGCILPTSITTLDEPLTQYCQLSSIGINYNIAGTFNSGNRFTAQLSDTNFNFSNPIVLGFVDGITATPIQGTLPAGLKTGKSYKIRVVASAPVTTGIENGAIIISDIPSSPVSISGKPSVCAGENNVTYSVTAQNGIKYRWKITGGAQIVSPVTADSSTITVNFGSSNAVLSVYAINSCGIWPALQKNINVTQPLTPSISINPTITTICQGDSVKLKTTFTNEGTAPKFNWKLNNQNIGTNTTSITVKNLKNKDSVLVILTSNDQCLTSQTAISGKLYFTVKDTLKPNVTIAGNTLACHGSLLTITANTKNRGLNPTFAWYVNNQVQNATDSIFKSNQLQNNDSVWGILTSNTVCARPKMVISNKLKINITNTVTPSVNISGNKSICKGSVLTLTAIGQNEGSKPIYNWYVNNELQNNSGSIFSSSVFNNKDSVYVTLISNDPCAQPTKTNSQLVKISVSQTIQSAISITGNKAVCQGENLTLIANTINRGTNPIFKWYLNNIFQNFTDSIFNASTLKKNDSIYVSLTSNSNCLNSASANSLIAKIDVKDTIQSTIMISGTNSFCQGTSTNYIANTQNRGSSPDFKWYVNGNIQTAADSVFNSSTLKNNDLIWATIEPKLQCAKPTLVTSNKIKTTVINTVNPEVTIQGPSYSCKGVLASFQAISKNEGQTPVYMWFKNDTAQKNSTASFASNQLNNGDKIRVQLQSDFPCALPEFVFSQSFTVIVLDSVKPKITVIYDSVYCENEIVNLKTTIENVGTKPSYAWFESNIGFDTSSSVSMQFPKGKHTITAKVKSNENCAFSPGAGSTVTFDIKDTITIKPIITGDTVICDGSTGNYGLKNKLPVNTFFNWIDIDNTTVNYNSDFTKTRLKNGETIYLKISGKEKCATYANSNTLTIQVIPSVIPEVITSVSKDTACPNETVEFKAVIKNRGSDEIFIWKINGVDQNINSESFTSAITPSQDIIFNYTSQLSCGKFSSDYSVPDVQFKSGPPVLTSISAPESYCAQDASILFTTDFYEQAKYNWSYPSNITALVNSNSLNVTLKGTTRDSIKVSATNDCGTGNIVSVILLPKDCQQLFIPTAIISSQEDGNNLWQIKGIESYENTNVMVFNRWGNKVFHSSGYKKPWDGTVDGKLLPTGTYYYVIEGVNDKPLTGALTIVH